jgi:hypothetical protein
VIRLPGDAWASANDIHRPFFLLLGFPSGAPPDVDETLSSKPPSRSASLAVDEMCRKRAGPSAVPPYQRVQTTTTSRAS